MFRISVSDVEYGTVQCCGIRSVFRENPAVGILSGLWGYYQGLDTLVTFKFCRDVLLFVTTLKRECVRYCMLSSVVIVSNKGT